MRLPGGQRARAALVAARKRRGRRRAAGTKLLGEFARAYPHATFIEVGSNDGAQHDHLEPLIRREGWSGVMVEPVPYVFDRLCRNYGDEPGVKLENAAIADRDGDLPFYFLAEAPVEERDSLPGWYDGIGSFSREVILGHGSHIPDIESRLRRETVPAMTFTTLCRRHGIEGPDLLVIDTEGYDWQLIRSIDFGLHHPRLMVYEHYHLGPADRAQCRRHVEAAGYETLEEGFDTWCLDTGPGDRLVSVWRGLSPVTPGLSAHGTA